VTANETLDSCDPLDRLVGEVGRRLDELTSNERGAFVGSELAAVDRALGRIRTKGHATGPVFCEWGSGLGGVCGVAALNGFTAFGIEIEPELVRSARSLATDLHLSMVFAEGTFLRPGDEDLAAAATPNTRLDFDNKAWDKLDLAPEDCDVVFAYPWHGEEGFVERVFARHATPDSLLVTFHDLDRVLVQRKLANNSELSPLGWLGEL
jgi:hypothetical protein